MAGMGISLGTGGTEREELRAVAEEAALLKALSIALWRRSSSLVKAEEDEEPDPDGLWLSGNLDFFAPEDPSPASAAGGLFPLVDFGRETAEELASAILDSFPPKRAKLPKLEGPLNASTHCAAR